MQTSRDKRFRVTLALHHVDCVNWMGPTLHEWWPFSFPNVHHQIGDIVVVIVIINVRSAPLTLESKEEDLKDSVNPPVLVSFYLNINTFPHLLYSHAAACAGHCRKDS